MDLNRRNRLNDEEEKMPHLTRYESLSRKDGKSEVYMDIYKKAKLESAIELLQNGVNLYIILKSTKLPKREIRKLAATIY
jgi:hypothetical protein